jgi:hypothetical protein
LPAQQQSGQRGRQRERHEHRCEHGKGEGEHERTAERAHQRAQEQERQRGEQDREDGEHQRPAHGGECRPDGRTDLPFAVGHAGLRDPAPHRVDVGDDVIDHHAHGRGEAEQRDRRERGAPQVQDIRRQHERHRHHDDADQRRAPRGEHSKRQGQQRETDERDPADVRQRCLDESRRTVLAGVDRDALQARHHVRHRPLDVPGDLERVGARKLLDHQEQAGRGARDRVTDQRLMVLDHVRHVAQPELSGLRALDGHVGKLPRRGYRGDVLHGEALVGGLEEAPGTGR